MKINCPKCGFVITTGKKKRIELNLIDEEIALLRRNAKKRKLTVSGYVEFLLQQVEAK